MDPDVQEHDQDGPGLKEFRAGIERAMQHDRPFRNAAQILQAAERHGIQIPKTEFNPDVVLAMLLGDLSAPVGPYPEDMRTLSESLSPEGQCYAAVEGIYLDTVKAREYIVGVVQKVAEHQGDVALRDALPRLVEDLFVFEEALFHVLWPDDQFSHAYEKIMTDKAPQFSLPGAEDIRKLPEDDRMGDLRKAAEAMRQQLEVVANEHLADVDPDGMWHDAAAIRERFLQATK